MEMLFATIQQRRRPEDVAQMIVDQFPETFTPAERRMLDRAAAGSLRQRLFKFTSMMEAFARPLAPERQVRKAAELFTNAYTMTSAECADAERVAAFIRHLSLEIKKAFGQSDFKRDRLNHAQRAEAGLELSRRRYNKLFRVLQRLEAKVKTYAREQRKFEFTRIGKSSLVTKLSWEEFARDRDSACFIAYYVARCNLRSEFTIAGQQRPYDEIASMLLTRCKERPQAAGWWAIAHVFPDAFVLAQLTDEQKGQLLGTWLTVLDDIASLLREVWERGGIDREKMIVRRGNDSSTWNNTANAWNKARASWIALLQDLGMTAELDAMCLGKVLRLMAGDVAAWHWMSGGNLETDTMVWNEIPLPWEVLAGEAVCTRAMIEEACRSHDIDPVKKGWTATPPKRVAPFRPTPELVHGVTAASPHLAAALKRAGWFSGKGGATWPDGVGAVRVQRDEHGFALRADEGEDA